jgi:hypothetical protein
MNEVCFFEEETQIEILKVLKEIIISRITNLKLFDNNHKILDTLFSKESEDEIEVAAEGFESGSGEEEELAEGEEDLYAGNGDIPESVALQIQMQIKSSSKKANA